MKQNKSSSSQSFLGRIMTCFPVLMVVLSLSAIYNFVLSPDFGGFLLIFAVIYGFPLLCFRLHNLIWPLEEGSFSIVGPEYSPWYGGHQIQLIFISLPCLEAVLRIVPGVYSAWLRLWGSQVGRSVYWTPIVEILDRSLLDIGDGVIFGYRSGATAHVISPKNGRLSLMVERVVIQKGALIGAASHLGPGVVVEEGAVIPVWTPIGPRRRIKSK